LPVELVMHVSRAEDSRLSGSVRSTQDACVREFSGTLEMMRVLEELVPSEPTGHRPDLSGGDGRSLRHTAPEATTDQGGPQ
jgi:hypothetical protein